MVASDPSVCTGPDEASEVGGTILMDLEGALHLFPDGPLKRKQTGVESEDTQDFGAESQETQHAGLESEETYKTVPAPSSVMMSKITAFNDQREEERKRMYDAVVWLFKVQTILGQPAFILSIIVNVVLHQVYIAKTIAMFGYFNTACSIVVLSTCPLDHLSIDDLAKRRPKIFAAFSLALAIVPLFRVMDYFPHVDALLCLVCIVTGCTALTRRKLPLWWPEMTTLMTLYVVVQYVSWGCQTLFPERNKLDILRPVAYTVGCYYLFCAVLIFTIWRLRLRRTLDRKKARGIGFYEAMYTAIMAEGISKAAKGVTMFLWHDEVRGILEVGIGVSLLLPPCVLLLLGRTRLFNIIGRGFDRDGTRLRRDGAFIAELLDNIPVKVGQPWWIHREVEDERYEPFDPRRKWQQGTVTEVVNEKEFVVQLAGSQMPSRQGSKAPVPPQASSNDMSPKSTPKPEHAIKASMGGAVRMQFPAAGGGKRMEDLLLQAQKNLRCVDFENLTPDLMYRVDAKDDPELQARWHGLSRPVRPGEIVDFFMSNSWYDNPEDKWQRLCEVAERHRRRYGRYPTIWLDKLCIDQNSITDELKVLPVNVMACHKLLALCGDTYLSRLWCIWELFTLFAFVTEAAALDRIKFVFLGDQDAGIDMLRGMSSFHVKDSHCYDPNEEARLRQVIDAVGTERFNQRISSMVALTCTRLEQEQKRRRSGGSMSRSLSMVSSSAPIQKRTLDGSIGRSYSSRQTFLGGAMGMAGAVGRAMSMQKTDSDGTVRNAEEPSLQKMYVSGPC